jgi:uncharacterized membrane-anchored protein
MKRNFITESIKNPTVPKTVIFLMTTLAMGTATGEIVSRPINSLFQGGCVLLTLIVAIISLSMSAKLILNYINNK